MESRKLNEQITVGAQPAPEDLQHLAQQGFRSVVNLRREGEAAQPLSPAAEGEQAAACGLRYFHLPISLDHLEPAQLDRFRTELETLPAPVYVHCRGGSRAGVLAMVREAVQAGQSGEEAVRALEAAGYLRDEPELGALLRKYVDGSFPRGD
jgi:uncharacterized protein (TIGR01244 family)